MLQRSQQRNSQEGITGLLLYSDGVFAQSIEGPRQAVERIYDVIRVDPLHENILEVLHGPVQTRSFPLWAMAFRSLGSGLTRTLRSPGDLDFSGPSLVGDASSGRQVLAAFWNQGLGRRYQNSLATRQVAPGVEYLAPGAASADRRRPTPDPLDKSGS